MTVLVAFVTDHGATRGIAERIARRLQEAGVDALALAMEDVSDPGSYTAAVLGSAIHNGKWLPGALLWANTHAPVLAAKPNWLFSVSSLGDEESAFPPKLASLMRRARKETPEISGLRQALRAREHRNFAGVIDGAHWGSTGRLFMKVARGRLGDHRNWPAIDAWASRIASQLATQDDAG